MMIKEYATYAGKNHFVIRNDHYGSSFKVIKELVQTAMSDFLPILNEDDIGVVQFGGMYYKYTCIKFSFDASVLPPDDYEFVSKLEVLL